MSKHKACTDEEIQRIRGEYLSGSTAQELSDKYFISTFTVLNYCKGVRVQEKSNKKLSEEKIQEILVECRKQELSLSDIAKKLNISRWVVQKYKNLHLGHKRYEKK